MKEIRDVRALALTQFPRGIELNLDREARKMFNPTLDNPLADPDFCAEWVNYLSRRAGKIYSYGGYMENRSFLWRGTYLTPTNSIHLGIDVNFPMATPIVCPIEFELLEAFYDGDQNGGWGGRVLIKTKYGLVLFAHIVTALAGKKYYRGNTIVGYVADKTNNGGWYPHLHIQGINDLRLMKNIDGYSKMYKDIRKDYPNPLPLLGIHRENPEKS
jgi:hypothetical protein